MLGLQGLPSMDPEGLPPEAAAVFARMRQRIEQQAALLQRKDREIALRDAKLKKVNFELARLKRWKLGARTEAMSAEQRALFQDAIAEDEASLQAQLAALQAGLPGRAWRRRPRRAGRVATRCPSIRGAWSIATSPRTPPVAAGSRMVRIGEETSERLDVAPAEFFVHRHVHGKWACRCCQLPRQEPAGPEVVDGGLPASGLVAHTLIGRFVDHLP